MIGENIETYNETDRQTGARQCINRLTMATSTQADTAIDSNVPLKLTTCI